MQRTLSRTFNFGASLLVSVTDKEVAKTDTSFLAYGAQGIGWQNGPFCYSCNKWSGLCPSFSDVWLVAATIISSRGLGFVDFSGWGGALKPGATGAAIATISIAPTLLVIPARFFSLRELRAMRRHGSCLLKAEQKGTLIPGVIFGRFQGRAVAPEAASIYLTNPQKKVQDGFGLSRDSFFDGLVPGVLLTTFLLGLGTDGGL